MKQNMSVYQGMRGGLVAAIKHTSGTIWGIIDRRRKQKLPPRFDRIEIFHNYMRADVDGKSFYIHLDDEHITDPRIMISLSK